MAAEPTDVNILIMPRKTSWTMKELSLTEFTEPKWILNRVLPSGLACIAGRPKVGKSWFLLQVAHAVSMGKETLKERAERGKVLFLALEDNPRRLKSRAQLQGVPANAPIRFETSWPNFANGGVDILANEIIRHDYRLVCIDTFSRIAGRADQDKVGEMTEAMSSLHALSLSGNRVILLSDHHRKPNLNNDASSDPIDDIMGSTAKAAVVDTALGLYRTRGTGGTILKIVGRDIEERELALRWNPMSYVWEFIGDFNGATPGTFKASVINAIPKIKSSGEIPSTSRIASFINSEKSNVSRAIAELVKDGVLIQGNRVGREVPYDLTQD